MSEAYSSETGFRDRITRLIRLQFLSPGSWKAALDRSDLPDEVTLLIREVVSQTRLLRFEKSEIATELIHHFQDGHDRGHRFEDLVRDFGATEVAVPLFRNSKLRSRPMSVKTFRGSMMVFGGGLISYLLLQLFFHSAKPNPTVDYIAKMNDAFEAIPADQNAWPLYRDVWVRHGFVNNGKHYEELWFEESDRDAEGVLWTDHKTHRRLIRPDDIGWDKATKKLDSLSELLDVFREGSSRPYVGVKMHLDLNRYSDEDFRALFPNMERNVTDSENEPEVPELWIDIAISEDAAKLLSGSTWGILLPHIQQFRRAARIFQVDCRYAMQQGENTRAIMNIETMFGLGKQSGDHPFLVCALVGAAIRSIGMDTVEELMTEHLDKLTDDDLQQLQAAVAKIEMSELFDYSRERDFAHDFIQRIYSDDGNGDGRMTAVGAEVLFGFSKLNSGFSGSTDSSGWSDPARWRKNYFVRKMAGPTKIFTAPTRKEAEELIDEAYVEIDRHLQTRMWEETDFDPRRYVDQNDSSGLLSSLGIGAVNFKRSRETKIARQDAVLLAIAMHRYQREHKQWPTSLIQLENDWIDRTPIDRISGKPLSFTVKDNAPVVYSLGHDGDDDGGDAKNLSDAPWYDEEGDGDWILWPTVD